LVVFAGQYALVAVGVAALARAGGLGLVAQSALEEAAAIVLALLALGLLHRPAWWLGLRRAPLPEALSAATAALAAVILAQPLYRRLVGSVPYGLPVAGVHLRHASALSAVGASVVIVGLAPWAEELWFRGWLYRTLRGRLRAPAATLVVAVVFAGVHYPQGRSLALTGSEATLAIALCVVVERTGSLYPAIAMHAFNNALALTHTPATITLGVSTVAVAALSIGACGVLCHPKRPAAASAARGWLGDRPSMR
jgi:membrane protease YdiL (CAAX protease family)